MNCFSLFGLIFEICLEFGFACRLHVNGLNNAGLLVYRLKLCDSRRDVGLGYRNLVLITLCDAFALEVKQMTLKAL